jgi:hypothetical protein
MALCNLLTVKKFRKKKSKQVKLMKNSKFRHLCKNLRKLKVTGSKSIKIEPTRVIGSVEKVKR